MVEQFEFDVFLSHSSKDKAVVRPIAERLRADGLKVWFDEWTLKAGEDPATQIEQGLEHSRVLVLCMSRTAFGADWSELEQQTLRFRDPTNDNRRFILLRLDDAPLKRRLAAFSYVDWRTATVESKYTRLRDACQPSTTRRALTDVGEPAGGHGAGHVVRLDHSGARVLNYAFTPDGTQVLSGASDMKVRLWDMETGRCKQVFEGHPSQGEDLIEGVWSVAWNADQSFFVSVAHDMRLWNVVTGRCLRLFNDSLKPEAFSVVWSNYDTYVLTAEDNDIVRMWDVNTGTCVRTFYGHRKNIRAVAWRRDDHRILSGSFDHSVRVWDVGSGKCLRVLWGHTELVWTVAWSSDGKRALSGSRDQTLRLWDLQTGRCLRVMEGHTGEVFTLAWRPNSPLAISGSYDRSVRLWNVETGRCLRVLEGHTEWVRTVAWSGSGDRAFSGDESGCVRVWQLSELVKKGQAQTLTIAVPQDQEDQVEYTNAKVLLVGESGVGKTGLSKVLAGEEWQPSDSTVGAWATQWKLPVSSDQGVEREIWLWDFGGQADQRLIHQLYMDETALAVLVFDGQKEDLFETLGQWDRDLTRASRNDFAKILVAGRVDAGGLRVSRTELDKFASERKFGRFIETSAKQNLGCDDLKTAIIEGINWNEIPCRTTEVLFKQLKEEIIRLKDEGRVLMRFNELRETLQMRLASDYKRFTDEELRAVITLLAGPGVVWELAFGSLILLQPERINAYAQAVIRTLQSDEHQRGCLMEERVLKGDLDYESSMPRLTGDEERFVLLAMHQILVERGLCLRQPTDKGNLLVFPSFYRRERPEQVKSPAVLVNYRFTGFLDDVYATLVVRLHHSDAFDQDQLWRYAADFKTKTGKQLGVKLHRRAPGLGELEVYFDPSVAMEEKIIFSKYVHEHLLQNAREVERLRHYVCQRCGTPVGNREVAMQRLNDWLQGRPPQPAKPLRFLKRKEETPSIICVGCEQRVPLWDDMEQCFASAETQQRVRDMQEESAIVLSNQSKERALVGEVISTVALANQISREFNVSDHGIDMEIEFTDDNHEATGVRIYLQLKSGDSYLHKRKDDRTEIFTIKNERHAHYWMAQPCPVLLVIRNSQGEVRWMEVRDWLKRKTENGKTIVKQIVFEGERFDVMSVRRWRDRCLGA